MEHGETEEFLDFSRIFQKNKAVSRLQSLDLEKQRPSNGILVLPAFLLYIHQPHLGFIFNSA